MLKHPTTRLMLASLLISGTTMGAAMLALPVATATCGLYPTIFIYTTCWLFSYLTGLLFLEVALWLPKEANIVSMASTFLKTPGKICSWILYLFLFYTLLVAYMSEGGKLFSSFTTLSPSLSILVFTAIFALIVAQGTKVVDKVNFILMIGFILTLGLFFIVGFSSITFDSHHLYNTKNMTATFPIILIAFSYQGLIPTMVTYLHRNIRQLRLALCIGTLTPLILYLLWELIIKSTVPLSGPDGLLHAQTIGSSAITPLVHSLPHSNIALLGRWFAFFAITTTFLGVGLPLLDFLSDSLSIPKNRFGKSIVSILGFIPPLLCAYANPQIFLKSLEYAGGFGSSLLLGLLPIAMVYSGRYILNYPKQPILKGGKTLLIILAIFVFYILYQEIYNIFSNTTY